jgi:hypothetical protein
VLLGAKVIPQDSRWTTACHRAHDARWRDHHVYSEVMSGLGQALVEQLQVVDGGHDGCVAGDKSALSQQREFQIGETPALADADACLVDRDCAADDQVDRLELVEPHRPTFA